MNKQTHVKNHLSGYPPRLWRAKGTVQKVADSTGASSRTVRRIRAELESRQLQRDEALKQTYIPQHTRTEATALMLYDIHFPHEDWEHIEIAIDHALTNFKIDILVLGGDAADLHRVSRWKKDPYEGMPFHEEVAYTANGLERIANRFPKAEKFYIKGNHEACLEDYLWKQAPEISRLKKLTVQEQLELESSGYQWVDNLKIKEETGRFFKIGRLNILHGHELGICPNISPARAYFIRSFDNVMVGHVHNVDNFYARTLSGKTLGSFVVGPCCDLNPNYRPQNDWVAGFAVTEFDANGYFKVNNYKIINGRVF